MAVLKNKKLKNPLPSVHILGKVCLCFRSPFFFVLFASMSKTVKGFKTFCRRMNI